MGAYTSFFKFKFSSCCLFSLLSLLITRLEPWPKEHWRRSPNQQRRMLDKSKSRWRKDVSHFTLLYYYRKEPLYKTESLTNVILLARTIAPKQHVLVKQKSLEKVWNTGEAVRRVLISRFVYRNWQLKSTRTLKSKCRSRPMLLESSRSWRRRRKARLLKWRTKRKSRSVVYTSPSRILSYNYFFHHNQRNMYSLFIIITIIIIITIQYIAPYLSFIHL